MKFANIFRSFPNVLRRKFCTQSPLDVKRYFRNPCDELQQYLQVPLHAETDVVFEPSVRDMLEAREMFTPSSDSIDIKYLTSAVEPDKCPVHELPEVTFIGHSNVGKSSLLQAIFNAVPNLVRTSRKPGQTKTVNFFKVKNKMCLVDMPGYGYRQPKTFATSVEGYLKTRRNLKRTFLLINGETGFNSWDEVALDMLEELHIPYTFIVTKIDKVMTSRKLRSLLELQQIRDKCLSSRCFPQIFMISSATYEGIGYLQTFIAHVTGNLLLQDTSQHLLLEDKQEPEVIQMTHKDLLK